MKIIDIQGEIKFEESMDLYNQFVQLDEYYESIVDANNRLINEEDMVELEDLRINIISNGGSAWMCNGIIDVLDSIKSKGVKVHTHATGVCASAGLRIFLQGHTRTSGKNTTFLYHNTQCGFDTDDIVNTMEYIQFLREQDKEFDEFILKTTNIPEEILKERKGKDLWFNYEKAMEWGILTPIEEPLLPTLTVEECIESFRQDGYTVVDEKELAESSELNPFIENEN